MYVISFSSIFRQRSKMRPALPKNRTDVNIEGKWAETLSGERFLLADDGEKNRILIFSTHENLMDLSSAGIWYMDGTFYSSPSYFYQLHTIHVMINGYMCPLVYGLLPNKQQATYQRFFTLIQSAADDKHIPLTPTTVMMDYETAAWQAVRSVFNGASVRGCFFHYTQCIWRNVQSSGLVVDFKDDQTMRKLVLRAAALPLVPPESVEDVWFNALEDCDIHTNNVTKFKDYVTERWVDIATQTSTP